MSNPKDPELFDSYYEDDAPSHQDIQEDMANSIGDPLWDNQKFEELPKEEQEPEYSDLCRIEPAKRLETCSLIPFHQFCHATKENDRYAGALLLEFVSQDTGEIVEKWVPKKLCQNLDLEAKTVYVWEVFAQEHLWHLIGE